MRRELKKYQAVAKVNKIVAEAEDEDEDGKYKAPSISERH